MGNRARHAARWMSGRKRRRRLPAEEAPGQARAVVENDARRNGWAIWKHSNLIAHEVSKRDMRLSLPSLRAKRSNPAFCSGEGWIASSQALLALTAS
jgi:hypothetical protein